MKRLVFTLVLAFVLWALMFSPLTASRFDFWPMMAGSALLLSGFATLFAPAWWERLRFTRTNIAWGVAIAVALWCVFWVGDKVASLLFSFARAEVDAVYAVKTGSSPWALSLLLLLLVGPAEEIYWRGFVQERLSKRWGADRGFLIATALYTLVHLPSCNLMLILAALVAGAAWGLCYRLWPERFTAIILSHALWDAAVFIWFPIM